MAAAPRPILVALGSEARALRLIQAGFRLARKLSAPWIAVHVETSQAGLIEDGEQAEVWLQEAQRLGAEIRIVQAPTLAQGLSEVTRSSRAQGQRSRDRPISRVWARELRVSSANPWARVGA